MAQTARYLVAIVEKGPDDGLFFHFPIEPGAAKTTIRIGRAGDPTTDIVLPGAESVVGLHHCDLEISNGTVTLKPRQYEEVFVDATEGKQAKNAEGDMKLFERGREHVLELGARLRSEVREQKDSSGNGNAQFRLRLSLADSPPTGMANAPRRVETEDQERSRRNARILSSRTQSARWLSVAVVAGLVFAGGSLIASTVGAAFAANGSGQATAANTKLDALRKQFNSFGRRLSEQYQLTASLIDVERGDLAVSLGAPTPNAPSTRDLMKAVWLIGWSDPASGPDQGDFHGLGTAWVYDPTPAPLGAKDSCKLRMDGPADAFTIVTNRHVARALRDVLNENPKRRVVMRRDDGDGAAVTRELDTKAVQDAAWSDHPQYAELDDKVDKTTRFVNVFDVSQLKLKAGEGSIAPGLQVAGEADMLALEADQPVRYIGFPNENLRGGGVNAINPQPVVVSGAIARVSDPFGLNQTDQSQNQLILVSATVAGGASGSPMINRNGCVVGIVSGGDVVNLDAKTISVKVAKLSEPLGAGEAAPTDYLRVPVGFGYAVRADVVRELPGSAPPPDPKRWNDRLVIFEDRAKSLGPGSRDVIVGYNRWRNNAGCRPEEVKATPPVDATLDGDGHFSLNRSLGKGDYYFSVRPLKGARLEAAFISKSEDASPGPVTRIAASLSQTAELSVVEAGDYVLKVTGDSRAQVLVEQFECRSK